ncbi:MAG: toprim domain-containing protein [archaeon]|nr:toprim domain-containing protein [archaeon]
MENSTMKTYEDYKIDLLGQTGTQARVFCPECTQSRKKKNIKDLAVNIVDGTFFCHHCGWKGGLKGNGKVFVKPDYIASAKLPSKVTEYFKSRGISEHTLTKNGIGYGPVWMPQTNTEVNAIQFPFYKNGAVVNIKYRDGNKNFRQAKNAEKCFYGFDDMKNDSKLLIITEGEIDKLSFNEAGFNEVVSIPDGAPSANSNNYTTKFDFLKSAEKHLTSYKKIIIAVDNDQPGKRAEEELVRRIGAGKCYQINYSKGCKDANDELKKNGIKSVKELIKNATPYPISGLFMPTDFKQKLEDIYDFGIKRGTATGWSSLDKFFSVRVGELTIITGIPSSGKSNFMDNLMSNLLSEGNWKFGVYSPENWPIENHLQTLCEKLTEQPFSVSYGDKFPRMSKNDINTVTKYLNKKIKFIQPAEDENPTIDKILSLARISLLRDGINALIIDPWNEVSHDFGNMTETQYISKQLGKLRRFGRLNKVHIFIVAHPQKLHKNSKGKYDAPDMYSIAGGAHFRNKADNGICVHRLYEEEKKDHVQIIIQKIRFKDIGKIGMTTLRYEYATGIYRDDISS